VLKKEHEWFKHNEFPETLQSEKCSLQMQLLSLKNLNAVLLQVRQYVAVFTQVKQLTSHFKHTTPLK
jgi:hypothetical protein